MTGMKKLPERTCIGCGQKKEKPDLIRIVHSQDDTFSIDPTGRKNGRGAYICNDLACFEKAIKRKALDRAFKVSISEATAQALREELIKLDR
jgi:predicted RNA-binding protein YlxR (DUF448 family)